MNPASRFGARQADKLRAVDDLRRNLTNGAADLQAPINLPSRNHNAQMCDLFVSDGELGPLSMPRADHAHAYGQVPLLEGGKLAAVVTSGNP